MHPTWNNFCLEKLRLASNMVYVHSVWVAETRDNAKNSGSGTTGVMGSCSPVFSKGFPLNISRDSLKGKRKGFCFQAIWKFQAESIKFY